MTGHQKHMLVIVFGLFILALLSGLLADRPRPLLGLSGYAVVFASVIFVLEESRLLGVRLTQGHALVFIFCWGWLFPLYLIGYRGRRSGVLTAALLVTYLVAAFLPPLLPVLSIGN